MASVVLACPLVPSRPALPRMGRGPSVTSVAIGTGTSLPRSPALAATAARTAAPKPCPCPGTGSLLWPRDEVGAVHPLRSTTRFSFSLRRVGLSASQNPHSDPLKEAGAVVPPGAGKEDGGSEVLFCCQICRRLAGKRECFGSTDELWKHCKDKHPEDAILRCDGCGNAFMNVHKLQRHRRNCRHAKKKDAVPPPEGKEGDGSEGWFYCGICLERQRKLVCFPSTNKLWDHFNIEHHGGKLHDEAKYRCYVCGKWFNNMDKCRQHTTQCVAARKKAGGKVPKYLCPICKKVCKDGRRFRRHTRSCKRAQKTEKRKAAKQLAREKKEAAKVLAESKAAATKTGSKV